MAYLIKKASTDITRYVMMVDSATGQPETGLTVTDFDLSYLRAGSDHSAKVDATALGSVDAEHSDNKAIEVDATLFPGLYRIDWPDAAFASGVSTVLLSATCSGCHPAIEEIQLVSFDPDDAAAAGLSRIDAAVSSRSDGTGVALHSDYDAAKTAAQAGDQMNLADDAITGAKFDESTAHPQTGDSFARLGSPAGDSVSADVAALKTVADDTNSKETSTNGTVVKFETMIEAVP